MEEFFDIVDEQDNVIGKSSKEEAHTKSLLHRTIHILILNSHGELLLQKRSQNQQIAPGHWGSSVGGHVSSGETYEQAAYRELQEELGIKTQLEKFSKLVSSHQGHNQLVTAFSGMSEGPFNPDPTEVEAVEFVKVGRIKREIRLSTRKFTPAFLEVFRIFCEVNGL